MKRPLLLAPILLAAAAPLAAQNIAANDDDQAEQRLRVCLSTGAPGAPRESLAAAIAALRSLCYNQITRVRELRVRKVDDDLRLPRIGLTPNQQIERERAREAATRKLNDEIARTISTLTGLTPERPPQAETPRPLVTDRPILLQGSVR